MSRHITSVVLWLMIGSMPIGGLWVQRSGRLDSAVMISCALTGLVLAGLPLAPGAAILFAIAIGLLTGPPPGAMMAMPGRALRPENRAVGVGLFMTVYNVTTAGGPIVAGALRDQFGVSAPVLFGAALFVSVAPLTVLFRRALSPTKIHAG